MEFEVKTGFGYYREVATDKVVDRVCLLPGIHQLKDGLEYVELETADDLDAVEVETDGVDDEHRIVARLVSEEIFEMALDRLKGRGVVRPDYDRGRR